jgi:hypothetical protein
MTMATGRALGMRGTAVIGAASLPSSATGTTGQSSPTGTAGPPAAQ